MQNKTADNNKAESIKILRSFGLDGGTFLLLWLGVGVSAGTRLEEKRNALEKVTFSFAVVLCVVICNVENWTPWFAIRGSIFEWEPFQDLI